MAAMRRRSRKTVSLSFPKLFKSDGLLFLPGSSEENYLPLNVNEHFSANSTITNRVTNKTLASY